MELLSLQPRGLCGFLCDHFARTDTRLHWVQCTVYTAHCTLHTVYPATIIFFLVEMSNCNFNTTILKTLTMLRWEEFLLLASCESHFWLHLTIKVSTAQRQKPWIFSTPWHGDPCLCTATAELTSFIFRAHLNKLFEEQNKPQGYVKPVCYAPTQSKRIIYMKSHSCLPFSIFSQPALTAPFFAYDLTGCR